MGMWNQVFPSIIHRLVAFTPFSAPESHQSKNARVEHPYAVLAIGGKTSSDMLDFSRELSETMAAGQAAGMPGTHIIHFSDFQGIVFTRTDTSYLPPEGA